MLILRKFREDDEEEFIKIMFKVRMIMMKTSLGRWPISSCVYIDNDK